MLSLFLLELGYNTLKGYFAELYLVDGSLSYHLSGILMLGCDVC